MIHKYNRNDTPSVTLNNADTFETESEVSTIDVTITVGNVPKQVTVSIQFSNTNPTYMV